jgi:polyhydroxyalkanoate synthesis regulator protein
MGGPAGSSFPVYSAQATICSARGRISMVTLPQVAAMIRAGDDVRAVHKDTGSDLTSATLAMIIFEEEKRAPKMGVPGLQGIIRTGRTP